MIWICSIKEPSNSLISMTGNKKKKRPEWLKELKPYAKPDAFKAFVYI